MSLYGLMEEAAEGRLSEVVRELWEKRNGEDPVREQEEYQSSLLTLSLTIVVIIGITATAMVTRNTITWEAITICAVIATLTVTLMLFTSIGVSLYMPKARGTKRRFDSLYQQACRFLGLSPTKIFPMNENELRQATDLHLKEIGRRVPVMEKLYGEYSPQKAKVKREFEEAYDVFKLMGWIDDVGYGQFIPKPDEVELTVEEMALAETPAESDSTPIATPTASTPSTT